LSLADHLDQGWPDFFAHGPNFENIFHRGPQIFNFWALLPHFVIFNDILVYNMNVILIFNNEKGWRAANKSWRAALWPCLL